MWYIHTTEYYSALKGKKIVTCAVTWMNLKDIMLKWNQPFRPGQILHDSIYMKYPEYKFIETEQNGDCQGTEREEYRKLLFNRYTASVWEDQKKKKKCFGENGGYGCTTMWMYQRITHSKMVKTSNFMLWICYYTHKTLHSLIFCLFMKIPGTSTAWGGDTRAELYSRKNSKLVAQGHSVLAAVSVLFALVAWIKPAVPGASLDPSQPKALPGHQNTKSTLPACVAHLPLHTVLDCTS